MQFGRGSRPAAAGTLPNDVDGGVIDSDQYFTGKANSGASAPAAEIRDCFLKATVHLVRPLLSFIGREEFTQD